MTFLRIVVPPYCPGHAMQVLILCSIAERKEFGGRSELGAAVDGDDVAGDPSRLVRDQERDDRSHVGGRADPIEALHSHDDGTAEPKKSGPPLLLVIRGAGLLSFMILIPFRGLRLRLLLCGVCRAPERTPGDAIRIDF